MTAGVRSEVTNPSDLHGDTSGATGTSYRAALRLRPQFGRRNRSPSVIDAARRPGLRLAEVIQTLVEGYADRPALGQRARELVLDPATGRTTTRLLPDFETISYGELWTQVRAVAAAWRRDETSPVNPGDFVATVGFAGPSYLTVELVCAYLGLVSVPLQHSAPASVLKPIIDEIEPRVLAAGAAYLDLAVESALQSASLRHLVVFDYQPQVDEHRDNLERARKRLHDAGMPVVVSTLDEVIQRGRELPPEPLYTGDTDQRLAMILYTSGSTGAPKGAMLTERTLARIYTSSLFETEHPVFNVNFMPLNHIAGRMPLAAAFLNGGTSYFVAESDLSTLFDDWALVRPTDLLLVPRVVEMLFQHYRSTVDRISLEGADIADAEQEAAIELRDQELGGRVLRTSVSTAPLAGELRAFLESCLDVHVGDLYGLTEVVPVTRDGIIVRPSVIDYKLIDVPELGYFTTDKPYPRGELLVKSENSTPGYYKRPEVTAEAFDEDGYYRTGDVMAEIAPDHVVYVDRRKNVLKLANGEFVAVANLEAVFSAAPLVRQIFVYGNSERSYLLAVIVPTAEALSQFGDDTAALKAALRESLQQTATAAELQSYEVPADFLIETETIQRGQRLAFRGRQESAAQTQGCLRCTFRAALRRAGRRAGERAPRVAPGGRRAAGAGHRDRGRTGGARIRGRRRGFRCTFHRPGRGFAVRADVLQFASGVAGRRGVGGGDCQSRERPEPDRRLHRDRTPVGVDAPHLRHDPRKGRNHRLRK